MFTGAQALVFPIICSAGLYRGSLSSLTRGLWPCVCLMRLKRVYFDGNEKEKAIVEEKYQTGIQRGS